MNEPRADWQSQAGAGLSRIDAAAMPGMELLYLDSLAVHLLGAGAPEPPYTIEHGTAIASMLLRAVTDAPAVVLDAAEEADQAVLAAREAVVGGAHRLGERGGLGAHQLVTRFLAAAVGELEQHREHPEAQVRSLFHYGLLALASGPENQTNAATSEGILAAFHAWDERIGEGFIPPWRIPTP